MYRLCFAPIEKLPSSCDPERIFTVSQLDICYRQQSYQLNTGLQVVALLDGDIVRLNQLILLVSRVIETQSLAPVEHTVHESREIQSSSLAVSVRDRSSLDMADVLLSELESRYHEPASSKLVFTG